MKRFHVYILASKRNGTLYVGVTSNLVVRVNQHKKNENIGFTQRYSVHRLVYFEGFEMMLDAIKFEKQLKSWRRKWKLDLIEGANPEWKDLSDSPAFDLSSY